jgi:tartrate dehydratase alpha subunit/fumarate hydratase class I-like protein
MEQIPTAVEWLMNEIKHIIPNDFLVKFEQAKEMEKEQIMKHSLELAKILISNPYETSGKMPTELTNSYINETFKSE